MKRIVGLVSIFCLAIIFSFGQGRDNYWCLGYASFQPDTLGGGITIDFPNNTRNIYDYPREMWFEFANTSVCDSVGNLLFYTNGIYIANAQDDTMLNGSGINPSFYTTQWYYVGLNIPQADIIIPKPGNDSLYYLFHETNNDANLIRPTFLYESVINMHGDSGKGEVIVKNHILINDTLVSGCITATRHANGRDWWLVAPEYGTDGGYYILLIKPDTIIINHQNFNLSHLGIGQACFSPDGSKYVWNQTDNHTYFYDFDRCTGVLSSPQYLVYTDSIYWIGASVSSNSRYAYVSHGPYIFQFDLQAANIPASKDTVAVNDGFADPNPPWYTRFVLHQLAPDGKIYISHGNSTFSLHCIDQPDSGGSACNVMQHSIHLPHFNVTIPSFPNYNLGRLVGSPCDTLQWAGIAEQQHDFKFRIYPNPITSNSLHIGYMLPQNKAGAFLIYDVTGKVVFKYNLPQWSTQQHIKLPGLSDGVYHCLITSGEYRVGKKLVVIKDE